METNNTDTRKDGLPDLSKAAIEGVNYTDAKYINASKEQSND